MTTRHGQIDSALGELTLVAAAEDLVGVYFPGHWTRPDRTGFGPLVTDDPTLTEVARQLGEYLTGQRREFELPTAAAGDEFEQRVWARLVELPYGATTTYGELADDLGGRHLAQAVGRAVGRNPLSIVVPCHRVLGQGDRLTGYAGGLRRKRFLLDLEQPVAARLF
jgi:methylated-DNA-[protein]-cysteine S-methyltransferase